MFTIKQPNTILFGKYSSRDFAFPENCLIITSKGAKNRGWLDYLKIKNARLKICIVSPELQNKSCNEIYKYKQILLENHFILLMMSTKKELIGGFMHKASLATININVCF